ncbi:MAG: DUF3500 domain-containing protein [Planctomycetes bacterium]|nr:DUF3500 domain-containing protein [Planctomycetota bacterium]
MNAKRLVCPDCTDGINRREFVRAVGGAAVAASVAPLLGLPSAWAAPSPSSAAETSAKRLYESLSDDQRKVVCFPFEHELRERINANWAITKPTITEFFNQDQQKLIDEIFRGVTSPDGYERFKKQMEDDAGGFGEYHVALFGAPGSGKFEFEMTGRHCTIRADGDCVEGVAFGGPMIYGHGEGDSTPGLPGNVFYYQTKKANEVFAALDGKQREKALVAKAPRENEVQVQGPGGKFPGIAVGELSSDQQGLVEGALKVLLAPYRQEDVEEVMAILKATGGLEKLHMAFFQDHDIGDDKVWDIWRIEGPSFVWHFRGAPHVHTYVNIAKKG